MSNENLDGILRKIQGLLAQANHPNTGAAEADTFRSKAEAMMWKYKIEEATTAKAQGITLKPEWREWPLCNRGNEFQNAYSSMAYYILSHCGCKGVHSYSGGDVLIKAVGYEADLRFAEALFTAAAVAFSARMEPRYDRALTNQVNAYLMRKAGMEGRRIAEMIYGKDDKHLRPKVRGFFKAESIARGENPDALLGKGVNVKQYRSDYASGFVTELYYRLQRMTIAKGQDSTGIVLAGREEAVKEEFYEKYPQYRPVKNPIGYIGTGQDSCAKCAKAKSGYCREHSYLRPSTSKARGSFNAAGYRAGQDAARTVDLGTTRGRLEH